MHTKLTIPERLKDLREDFDKKQYEIKKYSLLVLTST